MNLKQILSRTGETITAQRAERLNKVGIRKAKRMLEELEIAKEKLEDKIESARDISASVDLNAMQCKLSNSDMENIVNDIILYEEELHLINQRLAKRRETVQSLIGEDEK